MVGSRKRSDPEPELEERRNTRSPAPHPLLALQHSAGNQAVGRMLARLKLAENPLHEVTGSEAVVHDTDTMSLDEIKALTTRAMDAGDWDLYEKLLAEEEKAEARASGDTGKQEKAKETEPEKEPGPGGQVTIKTLFGPQHPLHGLPGLIGPPKAFVASLDQDLASDGINPKSPVTEILYWRPANTEDHVELGATVSGVYTKLDLVKGGYRLIHGAEPPIIGGKSKSSTETLSYTSCEKVPLVNVDARLFYATFLDTAKGLGDFNMDTNNCQRFANSMVSTLKAYAPKSEQQTRGEDDDLW